MCVAILTRPTYRSPRFLAQSLSRMLTTLGIENQVFYHGIPWLETLTSNSNTLGHRCKKIITERNIQQLENYRLFILADTLHSFRDDVSLEYIRKFNKPILLHSVFYLGGSTQQLKKLPQQVLAKFDGYLPVSSINEQDPINKSIVFPIGLDLTPTIPFTKKTNNFTALLDFQRSGYEKERKTQEQAINKLGIDLITLNKEYTFKDIEEIYSRSHISFLAFPESFGVPIAQLQFFGSYILSPNIMWAKRHIQRKKHSLFNDLNETDYSDNFIFYQDYNSLYNKVSQIIDTYDSNIVRTNFINAQPHFYQGNTQELWAALCRFIK